MASSRSGMLIPGVTLGRRPLAGRLAGTLPAPPLGAEWQGEVGDLSLGGNRSGP
eukprot:CAMPEP_0177385794 /NCGR_PEP_ID=MMETSP0368-20130122/50432_1 /TAXON_ID=447022 ORGANISM="Scrippsiella hangoei-like, Strain SHHI-4" /NCGR_SAMPLE_ID=MMETSP0368 /ASSEMBLY_ACC=CAM_ASM_000363 /LENGTH=53 /DNA_ID=CAMNT_0018850583 /DNA_START=179 /DNA_END=337 /DNA_ORIENTATION=+